MMEWGLDWVANTVATGLGSGSTVRGGDSPNEQLAAAVLDRDAARVAACLRGGADPRAQTRLRPPGVSSAMWADRGPVLALAAALGDIEIATLLLDAGAELEDELWSERSSPMSDWDYDEAYGTPLSVACASGRARMVRLLLERGAKIRAMGHRGSLLELAVKGGHATTARALIEHGARAGVRVLRYAIARGDRPTVQVLLEGGAPPGGAVAYARKHNQPELASWIEEHLATAGAGSGSGSR